MCTFWPVEKKVSVLSNLWGLAGICGGMKRYKFVLSHQWIYIYLCTSDLWGLAGICGGMRRWEGWVQAHPVAPGLHCAYPANIQLVNILLQKKSLGKNMFTQKAFPWQTGSPIPLHRANIFLCKNYICKHSFSNPLSGKYSHLYKHSSSKHASSKHSSSKHSSIKHWFC